MSMNVSSYDCFYVRFIGVRRVEFYGLIPCLIDNLLRLTAMPFSGKPAIVSGRYGAREQAKLLA